MSPVAQPIKEGSMEIGILTTFLIGILITGAIAWHEGREER
jgi:hypothetical protein